MHCTAPLVGDPTAWKHQLPVHGSHHLDQPHLPSSFWPVDQSRDVSEVTSCTLHDSAKVRWKWSVSHCLLYVSCPHMYVNAHIYTVVSWTRHLVWCTHNIRTYYNVIHTYITHFFILCIDYIWHCVLSASCRLWTVRFYSYFSLLIAVTTEIECTQPPSQQTGGQCSISFSIQDVANPVANPTADGPCPVVSVVCYLLTSSTSCVYVHLIECLGHFYCSHAHT